jgi:hypothetical protein
LVAARDFWLKWDERWEGCKDPIALEKELARLEDELSVLDTEFPKFKNQGLLLLEYGSEPEQYYAQCKRRIDRLKIKLHILRAPLRESATVRTAPSTTSSPAPSSPASADDKGAPTTAAHAQSGARFTRRFNGSG